MGDVAIRDAEPTDAGGIAAIGKVSVLDTYRGIVDPIVLRNIVEQNYADGALTACISRCSQAQDAHFIVAESEGRIVGFLHYDCEGPDPELHRIYIAPALKRRGIGSALLSELHTRLAPGANYILMVIAANSAAVMFYQRHGFVQQAQVDGPTYMSERMGVSFPGGTNPAPALVMRFTKPG